MMSPDIHILILKTCECYFSWQKGLLQVRLMKDFELGMLPWMIWAGLI